MKKLWVAFAAFPPAIVFALSAFAIAGHLAAPGTPAPPPGIYIGASSSFVVLVALFLINERARARRLKEQAVQAARHQIDNP